MKIYEHIFFDLDRTLWDYEASSAETFIELYGNYSLGRKGIPSFDDFVAKFIVHNDTLWQLYTNNLIIREELSVKRFVLTLAEFGIDDAVLAESMAEDYLQTSVMKIKLFPHTLETLDYLKKKYHLHLITNGFSDVQYKKIHHSGLKKYFTTVITSEEVGCHKPDKKIFLYAMEKACTEPDKCVMVGDCIETDIQGAKTVGMDQILFNNLGKSHAEEVTHEISSLIELTRLL